MAQSSTIEWTDATWNPVTGCSKVSPGCAHCYAETLTARFAGRPGYIEEHRPWTPENAEHNVRLHEDRLDQALRWKRPRMVFVNSMSDLFHELVPDSFIDRVFAVMGRRPQHVFQILTKRPERARDYFAGDRRKGIWDEGGVNLEFFAGWPLPNVWLGVSIENSRYTWRADVLREIPAAVRFLSCEPLLGSLFPPEPEIYATVHTEGERKVMQALLESPAARAKIERTLEVKKPLDLTGIDWLIVGGESGHEARPMHPDWARELRDRCLETVHATWHHPAFFFKQWGEWAPSDQCGVKNVKMSKRSFQYRSQRLAPDGTQYRADQPDLYSYPGMESLLRVGKKKAGRLLDGREWNEMPGGTHGQTTR